ncbi:MAG TPA: hypothetical protein VIL87_16735 [Dermatophilaceae bacterium]
MKAKLLPTPARVVAVNVEDLMAQLDSHGGFIEVRDPDSGTRVAYRRAIHEAGLADNLPHGYRIRHTGRDHGNLTIALVPVHDAPRARLGPIPIPERW